MKIMRLILIIDIQDIRVGLPREFESFETSPLVLLPTISKFY